MVPSSLQTEARRWVKFPATVLLATALLWLLHSYFNLDLKTIGQRSESFIGALFVFCELVLIPLGSVAVALGMLTLHRWALALGYFMPLLPLILVTIDKTHRVALKFTEYRATGEISSFGGGVMTALLIAALWAVYVLIVLYILKSWHMLQQARQWLKGPATDAGPRRAVDAMRAGPAGQASDEGDYCLLMPENNQEETT
jgi:hypothetical protein